MVERKRVSIVSPTFNEEENVRQIYEQVRDVLGGLPQYDYEHVFIDNASSDRTVDILREIAAHDPRVKVIVNSRNFGSVRSHCHGLLQTSGDAAISIAADLQEPPQLIPEMLAKWDAGFKMVLAVKKGSGEARPVYRLRKLYYRTLSRLSEIELIENFNGFGLYDKAVIDILRGLDDPYPYFRGIVCDIAMKSARIEYFQPARKRGITKNNFYALYDMAMLGMTNHSKVPLRLATMMGFAFSSLSLLVGLVYFLYKLVFWRSFSVGIAPLVIGLFLFASVQLLFLGIVGEYVGSIHTQVLRRPLVIENERINFGPPVTSAAKPSDLPRRT